MNLVIDTLGRQYSNGTWGLRAFSMDFEPGLWVVLGPVGVGKTTLLSMLSTVLRPTEGTIRWQERDIWANPTAFRRLLGYVPQHFATYGQLSGRQFLLYLAALKGLGGKKSSLRTDALLEQVGLADVADLPVGSWSNDGRRRLALDQALLNDPQVLIVDEPGESLTDAECADFCQLLGVVGQDRLTIVATERGVHDVASFAERLVLLQEGQLLLCQTPQEMVQSVSGRVWSLVVTPNTLVEIRRQYLISKQEREAGEITLRVLADAKPHPDAAVIEPTLEDAYAYFMNQDVS